ncbi:nuclear transport factor 2 family protein [Burkholderia sp. MR1-5-21]
MRGAFARARLVTRPSRSRLRTTWVIVRREGRWKILQHHFSAPPDVPPL